MVVVVAAAVVMVVVVVKEGQIPLHQIHSTAAAAAGTETVRWVVLAAGNMDYIRGLGAVVGIQTIIVEEMMNYLIALVFAWVHQVLATPKTQD